MTTHENVAPFEGPEKLLEIWFAPSPASVPSTPADDLFTRRVDQGRTGLRTVPKQVWEDMLDIVKCKVLSLVEGSHIDAYLLSESSLFVFPHKLILKTCGTTLNLLGLPRILAIAAERCNMRSVWRCFYSRKSFMFPERQQGPHREWKDEVEFLDAIFKDSGGGAAYTVGKYNGDHWLLYMTHPKPELDAACSDDGPEDYTIELLMSDLAPEASAPFFSSVDNTDIDADLLSDPEVSPEKQIALALSDELGITALFPPGSTTLDAYAFSPCGYSANALVAAGAEEGYYTIHVTPEAGWSFASFECNVQLAQETPPGTPARSKARMPDLRTLVRRVVDVFKPGRLSLTLFVSAPDLSPPPSPTSSGFDSGVQDSGESAATSDGEEPETAKPKAGGGNRVAIPLAIDTLHAHIAAEVEIAQRAFLQALTASGYRRTDKINYEFGGYDLAFASFEKMHAA